MDILARKKLKLVALNIGIYGFLSVFLFLLKTHSKVLRHPAAGWLIPASIAVCIVATSCCFLFRRHSHPDRSSEVSLKWQVLFVIVFSIFFCFRAYQGADYSPPYFGGESRSMEHFARRFLVVPGYWKDCLVDYNIGLAPFYTPVFAVTGYSLAASKAFVTGYFLLILLGIYLVFQRAYPHINPFTSFLIIVPLELMLDVLRTHKWHAAALLATLAVFIAGLGNQSRSPGKYWITSIIVLMISVFMYRGCLVYLPVLLALVLFDAVSMKKTRAFPSRFIAWIAGMSIGLYFLCPKVFSQFILTRMNTQLSRFTFSKKVVIRILSSYVDTLFTDGMVAVYSLFFIAGVIYSVVNVRRQWVARYCLVTGAVIAIGLFFTRYGLENPDENNYILIPILLFIVSGTIPLQELALNFNGWWRKVVYVFIAGVVLIGIHSEWKGSISKAAYAVTFPFNGSCAILETGKHLENDQQNTLHFFHSEITEFRHLSFYPRYQKILENSRVFVIDEIGEVAALLESSLIMPSSINLRIYLHQRGLSHQEATLEKLLGTDLHCETIDPLESGVPFKVIRGTIHVKRTDTIDRLSADFALLSHFLPGSLTTMMYYNLSFDR